MSIDALHHLRDLLGNHQPQLMYCQDDNLYVVFTGWTRRGGERLAATYLGNRLGRLVGLPVPECELIVINKCLVKEIPEIRAQAMMRTPDFDGPETLHFGSRFMPGLRGGPIWNLLPSADLLSTTGLEYFAAALAFDLWCTNWCPRQALFYRSPGASNYNLNFVGFSSCFSKGKHTPSKASECLYPLATAYRGIANWDSFEPCLGNMIDIRRGALEAICEEIPKQWYAHQPTLLRTMTQTLLDGRTTIHKRVHDVICKCPETFPNWRPRIVQPNRHAAGSWV